MDYLEIQSTSFPEQKEHFNEILDCLSKKLWHQMAVKLDGLKEIPFFQTGSQLLNLHENVVAKVWKNVNPKVYVFFTIAASKQHTDTAAKLAFLEGILDKVKEDLQAAVLCKAELAMLQLSADAIPASKALLDEGHKLMGSYPGIVDSPIQAHMYLAAMGYYKVKGPAAEYYKNSLQYLTYTTLTDLSVEEQVMLAADVSLAAIVGKGIYTFGELLQHPVVTKLHGTPQQWLAELLLAFNRGDIVTFKKILAVQGAAEPVLKGAAPFLREKIQIMALIEMVFSKDAQNRLIDFEEIARTCDCKLEEVELLLMKSFSLGVCKGIIDQVDGKVRVKWVQPRVLDVKQLATIRDRLQGWSAQVSNSAKFMEATAPELLVGR